MPRLKQLYQLMDQNEIDTFFGDELENNEPWRELDLESNKIVDRNDIEVQKKVNFK
jgi:hypothetical protein